MRGLNLDQLAAFTAVVELGGFSAAAARLNLTQPAISFQIRQLERRLGIRLIERVGRRINWAQRNYQLALKQLLDIRAKRAAEPEPEAHTYRGVNGRTRARPRL